MRARDLLHKTHIHEFRAWLEDRGYIFEIPKGDYEVLRMRHENDQHPLLVYKRDDMPEHLTVHGVAYRMAKMFYRERRQQRAAVEELTQQAQDWGMYETIRGQEPNNEVFHHGDPVRSQEERYPPPAGEED